MVRITHKESTQELIGKALFYSLRFAPSLLAMSMELFRIAWKDDTPRIVDDPEMLVDDTEHRSISQLFNDQAAAVLAASTFTQGT